MVLLAVMLLPSYLDVFVGRKFHRNLIDFIPKCALNDVLNSALLETILLVLLRDKQTLVITRDIATVMEINLLGKNQNKLED